MSNDAKPAAVVYFGMRCPFSGPPLEALLSAGHDVRALVLPGPLFGPPIIHQPPTRSLPFVEEAYGNDVETIARQAGVPILSIRDPRHADVSAAIAALHPTVIAVACFPWRLPNVLLHLPPLGCLNIHPSLLPKGRGPEPVFWTFRRGERQTGTTIHLMNECFDAGPIVLQEQISVPDGLRAPELERQLAAIGGRLLIDAIARLTTGAARPTPQHDAAATPAPPPTDDDFLISTDQPARWAFTFARGVAPLAGPLELLDIETGERFPLQDALDYSPTSRRDTTVHRQGDTITAQFHPGTARFLLRP